MPKVSVCMPTFNGGQYLRAQIDSILDQLDVGDELIISDDGSTDDTLTVAESFQDPRIRVLRRGGAPSLIMNVENALRHVTGDYIFLADQDDVWREGRLATMMSELERHDLVVCDCFVTDSDLNITHLSLFALQGSGPGLFKNLVKNSYVGCCMAFKAGVLESVLPFPRNIPMHDWWIGLVGECFHDIIFLKNPLLYYRRHGGNLSVTSGRSRNSIAVRVYWRFVLAYHLALKVITQKK